MGAAATAISVVAGSEAGVILAAVLVGAGIGTTAPSGAELIMSSASAENAGAVAGVNETIVEAAGAFGIAVLGTVLAATGPSSAADYAAPLPIAAVVALVAAIGVGRGLRARAPRRTTRRSRSPLAP